MDLILLSLVSARSPVFLGMFASGMREPESGRVTLHGFSVEVVQEMLAYMYTGRVRNWEGNAASLLQIADQYLIPGLKVEAERVLVQSLNVENAAESLLLGSLFQALTLKEETSDFIQS